MIILDTSVISETQRTEPDQNVMQYLNKCDPTTTYITSITVCEIRYGIDMLPIGKRKSQLESSAFSIFKMFNDRILAFDYDAASHHAFMAADARSRGNPVGLADGMIGGIARSKTATVATRDTSPFDAMGIRVVNPWKIQKPDWGLED